MASLLILKELLKYHDCHWNYTLPSPPPPLLVTGSLWGILKWQLVDRSQRYFFRVKLLNATHLHVDYLQLSRGRRTFHLKTESSLVGGGTRSLTFYTPLQKGARKRQRWSDSASKERNYLPEAVSTCRPASRAVDAYEIPKWYSVWLQLLDKGVKTRVGKIIEL